MKKHKAFSLIELSIVILIIGILIAGVTQANRLVNKFKLTTARTLTESSPVNSIKNLVAWYETTSESSFKDSETNVNSGLSAWYDINPQSTNKSNATQATTNNQPTYVLDKTSGLPMVYFNGNSSYFDLPDATIPYGNSSFTIFIVSYPTSNDSFDKTFISTEEVENQNNHIVRYRSNNSFNDVIFSATEGNEDFDHGGTPVVNKVFLEVSSYDNSTSILKSHRNGVAGNSATLTHILTVSTVNNTIGVRKNTDGGVVGDWMFGNIGEIIIFDRSLKDEERKAVENYLGKKWGITITN
ncbi:MAG: prepilin-type N-terminal cleavage/methylation domain-containing protein [Rickettsiales bacterium]|nr:prepilin-type N-terminal cleavage/methylation domain-containing protein [Rickettsiales bacterium]